MTIADSLHDAYRSLITTKYFPDPSAGNFCFNASTEASLKGTESYF